LWGGAGWAWLKGFGLAMSYRHASPDFEGKCEKTFFFCNQITLLS
jgi:hypothetical protein